MRSIVAGVDARFDTVEFDVVAQRQMPAVLVVDPGGRAIMATEQCRTILREFEQEYRPRGFGELPEALAAAVSELMVSLEKRPNRSAFTLLGTDLCVRACRLGSGFGTYVLISLERVKRSNTVRLNLARYRLTPREFQAALLVVQGLSNRSIANKLYLSESTVEGYLKQIYNKINVHSRAALAAKLLGEP